MPPKPFTDKPIMDATYTVLCRDGYAGLSIGAIANEIGKSKSLIYYHYDNKHDLIISFLHELHGELETLLGRLTDETPQQRFNDLIDILVSLDPEMRSLHKALLELKAETPFDDDIAIEFQRFDTLLIERFTSIYEELGFDDPTAEATITTAMLDGLIDRELGYPPKIDLERIITYLKSKTTEDTYL